MDFQSRIVDAFDLEGRGLAVVVVPSTGHVQPGDRVVITGEGERRPATVQAVGFITGPGVPSGAVQLILTGADVTMIRPGDGLSSA